MEEALIPLTWCARLPAYYREIVVQSFDSSRSYLEVNLARVAKAASACAVVALALAVGPSFASGVPIHPGDVFINLAVGSGYTRDNRILHFNSQGKLLDTFDFGTSYDIYWDAGFDRASTLYTAFQNTALKTGGVVKIDQNGNEPGSFGVGGYTYPVSIAFDQAGNLYVGQDTPDAGGDASVHKFDKSDHLLDTFPVSADPSSGFGVLYAAIATDQCTLRYTSEGYSILQYNVCTHTQLPNFVNSIPEPSVYGQGVELLTGIQQLADGDLLVATWDTVFLLDGSGKVIKNYNYPGTSKYYWFPANIALDPDNKTVWVFDDFTGDVYRIDIQSGDLVTEFSSFDPNLYEVGGGIAVAPQIGICPPIGKDTDCGVVITVTNKGATVSGTNQPSYNGHGSSLVGVVNKSDLPISILGLVGPGMFQFDGDGIDHYGATRNQSDLTGYGGPNAYFSNLVTVGTGPNTGLVHFITPINANGGASYFSLEGGLDTAIACTSAIDNALAKPTVNGPVITTSFIPNYGYTLKQVAFLCGFSALDWQQKITSMPSPSPFFQVGTPKFLTAPPPFYDPPPGGYTYLSGDNSYPFFYDPDTGDLAKHEPSDFELDFMDDPTNYCLFGGREDGSYGRQCLGERALRGQIMAFTTHLVGVKGRTAVDLGIGFDWTSNFNGTSGGVATTKNELPPDPGSGTGSATVVDVSEVSDYSKFGVSSINGVSVGQPQTLVWGALCNGTFTGSFNGNIIVSAGQSCVFESGSINGSILENGGNLVLSDSLVTGDVHIKGGTFLLKKYSELQGNLHIQHLTAGAFPDQICETTVHGNFDFHNNSSSLQMGSSNHAVCGGSVIGGNVQIQQNDGKVEIYDNNVTGILHCDHDANISGSGNSAEKKIGQCAGL